MYRDLILDTFRKYLPQPCLNQRAFIERSPLAPCSAAQRAISRPMPLEAPVTTTTRPGRRGEPPTIGAGDVECSSRCVNTRDFCILTKPLQTWAEKKWTVSLSTSLACPALDGCSRAETFSQLSPIYFAQPCTLETGYKVAMCRRGNQHYMWIYSITGLMLL